jgi:hypothetical protein
MKLFIFEIVFIAIVFFIINRSKIVSKLRIEENSNRYFALLLVLAALLAIGMIENGHNWGDDFAEYIAQTRAIVEGTIDQQVAANTFIVDHSPTGYAPIVYSWGLPLLLAPVYAILGFNLVAFKMVEVIFWVLFIAVLYFLCKKRFGALAALEVTLFFVVNRSYLNEVNSVLSDIPFLFFSTLSIYALYELLYGEKRQMLWGGILGVSVLWGWFCRENGVILVLTILCMNFLSLAGKIFHKTKFVKQKLLPYSLTYGIILTGKVAESFFLGGSGDYGRQLQTISMNSILDNVQNYAGALPGLFNLKDPLDTLLAIVFVIVMLIGVVRHFWNEIPMVVYCMGTMAACLLFPYFPGLRYTLPIIPLLTILSAEGIQELTENGICKSKICKELVFGVCALMLCFTVRRIAVRGLGFESGNVAYSAEAIDVYNYIIENTDENAVIVFDKPRALYLNTDRLGFVVRDNIIQLYDADYVLVKADGLEDTSQQIVEEVEKNVEVFSLVFENKNFWLYKVRKDS